VLSPALYGTALIWLARPDELAEPPNVRSRSEEYGYEQSSPDWLPWTPVSPDTGELANKMTAQAQGAMRLSITRSAHGPVDFVQILGDVDLSNTHELDLAAGRLHDDPASIIYVDLGGVTFMGSTLVAFLVHVCNGGGDRRPVVLCRPSPMALRVIVMTGLDQFASVHEQLPPLWPYYAGDPEPASRPPEGRPP
jgi:anti-anti-sigma factor